MANFSRSAVAGFGMAATLLLAACGSGTGGDVTAAPTTPPPQTPASEPQNPESAAPGETLFPDLNVQEIATGSTINLKEELSGGDRPVLLWFWAPH